MLSDVVFIIEKRTRLDFNVIVMVKIEMYFYEVVKRFRERGRAAPASAPPRVDSGRARTLAFLLTLKSNIRFDIYFSATRYLVIYLIFLYNRLVYTYILLYYFDLFYQTCTIIY